MHFLVLAWLKQVEQYIGIRGNSQQVRFCLATAKASQSQQEGMMVDIMGVRCTPSGLPLLEVRWYYAGESEMSEAKVAVVKATAEDSGPRIIPKATKAAVVGWGIRGGSTSAGKSSCAMHAQYCYS